MMDQEFWLLWWKFFERIISPAIFATLRMVSSTMIIGFICGFGIAILMTMYGPHGLKYNKSIYRILDVFVNSVRSFPILILIVAIIPLTRLLVGTSVGETAAIVPLSIAATAFIARLLEINFIEVDRQLIEAARSFGATDIQIVFRVIIKESVPSIVSTFTLAAINFLSATTIAGAVGGGGLGAIALTYGYQSFNNMVLYTAVVFLFIIVIFIQSMGNWLYKKVQ